MDETVFAACARLTAAFAVYVDHYRYDDLGALFTEDCRFERPGATLNSRAELVAFMSGRDRAQLTRHVCSPPLVEIDGKDAARGITYLAFFQGKAAAEGPGRLTGAAAFAEYHDRFRKTSDGWRIAKRRVVPVMMAG